MSEQAPDRLWSGIQITKVVAGTLAAVAAATLGSFLGVAGTLAGAALASVVGSVGTQLFDNSLKRGTKTLQTVAPTFIKAPAAVGTPAVAAATEEEKPSQTVPQPEQGRFSIRWKPILLGTATIFLLAMGAIFAVEAMAGRSLTSVTTGHDPGGGSTLTSVFSRDDKDGKPTPSPSETPAPGESSAPDSSTSQAPEPGATTGTPEPTGTTTAPAEPTTEPATEPATEAPQQTDPPAGGDQQQFDQQEQQQDPTSE
ncbi:hypothetical protein [Actinoplanes sp. NPDC049316]|uniref:hypothetical protein n=1 Tax=Actinoplanes sp. NPDC049316 TaxID=3154727 RepID=UPI00341AAAC7